jgi:hypothetical protein
MTGSDIITLLGFAVIVALVVKGLWGQLKAPPREGPPLQTGGHTP